MLSVHSSRLAYLRSRWYDGGLSPFHLDKTYGAFTDAERAVFDFAIAASSVPNGVTDEHAENLRKYWEEGEIVEILGVIALFGYLNRWSDSMGTQLEDPAADDGEKYLSKKGWNRGKHAY